MLSLATLLVAVGVLMISFANWREIAQIQDTLDKRLAQLGEKVAAGPAPAAQPAAQRGPDPNRVYQIKTAGAPSKGPAGAPVVVAEFSDFQ